MINILLESYEINADWLYDELSKYIKSHFKVAVIAFSFRDNRVKNIDDWNLLYGREHGRFYTGIVESFSVYGIPEENITFINYFVDTKETAADKIKQADIIYFLGGLPDRMMYRINEFDLLDVLMHHSGVVMGYSAGAVIQLSEYHLSPSDDYPEFGFYSGIPYINDFYIEVHYCGTDIQKESIARVIKERGKPVYATHFKKGAIIVDNGKLKCLGMVDTFK